VVRRKNESKTAKSAEKALPPTRRDKKEETREKVRRAALELFTDLGFDETTTKAVADRAGVATGTVFVHARDKVDLLCLVMHGEIEATVTSAFATLPGPETPLLERLLHVFRAVFAMYGRHPKLAPAFIKNLPGANGPNGLAVSQNTFEFLGRLAALLSDAQARGEIAGDVPPLLFAQNVFALYYFSLLGWVSGYTTLELAVDPHLSSALALLLRGLDR
jgi:AcrR family transcriptional regulator